MARIVGQPGQLIRNQQVLVPSIIKSGEAVSHLKFSDQMLRPGRFALS